MNLIVKELEALNKLSASELKQIQSKKLRSHVRYHYSNCRAYRNLMNDKGIKPSDINSVDDLHKLPIVDKKELIDNAPWGFTSLPRSQIKRFMQTSGSTGKPKLIAISENDHKYIANLAAKCFYIGGVRPGNVVLNMTAHGPWASGYLAQNGAEQLTTTIPGDVTLPIEWHKWAIKTYNPDHLASSPSFLAKVYQECKDEIDFHALNLKTILCGGETSVGRFRKKLEDSFGAKFMSSYGTTETGIIAAECEHQDRFHYLADQVIMEIADAKTGEPLAPGEKGDLLITTLFKDSMPLIRYRIHDMAFTMADECSCDLKLPAISHIVGRSDEMMTLGSANVYPSQIWEAITKVPELSDKFQFVIQKENLRDQATLKAEVLSEEANYTHISESIKNYLFQNIPELNHAINIAGTVNDIQIELHQKGELYKPGFKFKRFIDNRREE